MTFSAVLFDFDYTLGDSSTGIHDCINFAMERMGLPAVDYETGCRVIGMSLPHAFVALTGDTSDRSSEFKRLFIERADEVMVDRTVLFPTVRSMVRMLRSMDLRLGIVSTKYRKRLEAVLDREDLRGEFDVVIGADDVREPKPDPEALYLAVERLGIDAERSLFVGDSVIDAEAAMRASMPFAAVLTGPTAAESFAPFPVRALLRSLDDLPALLAATSASRP
jgi:phosphoglycolate phosphatase